MHADYILHMQNIINILFALPQASQRNVKKTGNLVHEILDLIEDFAGSEHEKGWFT